MTETKISLSDFAAEHRVLTYWRHVGGFDKLLIDDEGTEFDSLDAILELEGSVDEHGHWLWDGVGSPRDERGNTISRLYCESDPDAYAAQEEADACEVLGPLVDLPESLSAWSVLPEDAGQTIETAYAVDWESEDLWRQTTDQSYPVSDSRRVTYSVAPIESGEYEPQNGELPEVGTWRSVRVRATK